MASKGEMIAAGMKRKRPPSAMEMATVTDDIADSDIKCNCAGGKRRPPTGHTIFKCRDCDKWCHHNCMVGDKQITPAVLRNGYVCDSCKVEARSQSARKGAATKRKLGFYGQSSATPEAPPSKKPNFNGSSPRQPTIRSGLSMGDVEEDAPTKMRFQLSAPKVKSTLGQSDDNDDDDDPIRDNTEVNDAPGTRAASWSFTSALLGRGKSGQEDVPMGGSMDSLQVEKQPKAMGEFAKDRSMTTRSPQVIPAAAEANLRLHWRNMLEQTRRLNAIAQNSASRALADAQRRQQVAKLQREHILRQVCLKHMWKHYCSLPHGEASMVVLELTRTQYSDGQMVPVYEPPPRWSAAVLASILALRGEAGNIIVDVCGSDATALSMNNPNRLLRTLREIAVIVIHHGAWKGDRYKVGVLGEVLGLLEKGTVFKG